MLRFTTLSIKAHFDEISDIIIIIIIVIIRCIIISQQKRNRNTLGLFYSKHDQRFSSTQKGRKIHMELSRHFAPIKLPSSKNLEYPPNFSVTFTEKDFEFPEF